MRRVISCVILILIASLGGCAEKQQAPVSETRVLLDTYCTITIYGTHDPELLDEAFGLCAEYEALFSITIENSDIWRINHAGGAPVAVAPQTCELIKAGMDFGELSGGMFDITIGRISTMWDFSGDPQVPAQEELDAMLRTVDFRKIIIGGDTVRLADPEAWIDLGGIAKGYIADRLASFLRENGIKNAVIDLGGDIAVIGKKPDGNPWMIGVKQPFGDRNDLLGIVKTAEASIVTSGIYERQFVEDGIQYHHILDPYTGMPSRSDVIGATIMAESAAAGDALSTIAVLKGSKKAADLLSNAQGFIGALLVLENGELLQIGDIDFEEIVTK